MSSSASASAGDEARQASRTKRGSLAKRAMNIGSPLCALHHTQIECRAEIDMKDGHETIHCGGAAVAGGKLVLPGTDGSCRFRRQRMADRRRQTAIVRRHTD